MSDTHVKPKFAAPANSAESQARRRRQRPEARRSIAAILDAAIETLNGNPSASVEDIARNAGVSRQTVYAHFPTREALLDAVIEHATAEMTAAFDAAQTAAGQTDDEKSADASSPVVALLEFLEAGWQAAARYPFMWRLPSVTSERDASRHAPVVGPMVELIRRAQDSGELDNTLSPEWLLTASLAVGRAAQDEVKAGRMTIEEATRVMRQSFIRLLGVS